MAAKYDFKTAPDVQGKKNNPPSIRRLWHQEPKI